jgi:hypothetical protein
MKRILIPAAVAAAVLAVLAGGAWAVASAPPPAAGPGRVALPDGGVVTVDQVVSAARPRHAMPGMGTDNDPVADGQRRVSVDVTLRTSAGQSLTYAVNRFSLAVPGAKARKPHRSVLPGKSLPAGTQLSGTLIFDVPVEAGTGVLAYNGGGSTEVVLPPETAVSADPASGGHESAGHEGAERTSPGGSTAATPATSDR